MPTHVYSKMNGKNHTFSSFQQDDSSHGMRNSVHVDAAVQAQKSLASDQMKCFSETSRDVYGRESHPNALHTERSGCHDNNTHHVHSQHEGGRASNFAQHANRQVNKNSVEQMQMMKQMKYENMNHKPMMNAIAEDSYLTMDQAYMKKGRIEKYHDQKKVIMGRMPEAAKKKEFFTNSCGM